jgi:hypothetical protein
MLTSEIVIRGDADRAVQAPAQQKLEPLPDSRLRELKGLVFDKKLGWLRPIFCANCGKPGGYVTLDAVDPDSGFAFYMCTSPCWEKFGLKTEFMAVPDAIIRAAIRQDQGQDQLAEANNVGAS